MFNKHLLLCLAVIAGNSWAHDERLEKMMLNDYNNRLFDLNDKIEQLQHETQAITTLLANNQSSARKNNFIRCAAMVPWLYTLHAKLNDKAFISTQNTFTEALINCVSNLLADRWFITSTASAITALCKFSMDQNTLSTKINLQKQALKRLDVRLEKLMHQKQLLEESNKPDSVIISIPLQYGLDYQAKKQADVL